MPLFPALGLGEAIVLELRRGPRDMSVLLRDLRTRGYRVTKQGVYKALRLLRSDEMVFLHAGEASLNLRWLDRLECFVSLTQHAYADPSAGAGHFLNLEEGERIVYSFKNPILLDAFWNHVLYLLCEAIPDVDGWYAYASHCWFMLVREKEEKALYRFLNKRGLRVLYTVAHKTALDRLVAKEFDGDMTQYHMADESPFKARRHHLGLVVNVMGDFVIETQYDKRVTSAIEQFYQAHKTVETRYLKELESIVSIPARTRLIITKNAAKARTLRKMFDKQFYIPVKTKK